MKTLFYAKELPVEDFLKKISKKYVWSLLVYLEKFPCRFYDLETRFLRNKRELSKGLTILKGLDLIERTHVSKNGRDYLAYQINAKGLEVVAKIRALKQITADSGRH